MTEGDVGEELMVGVGREATVFNAVINPPIAVMVNAIPVRMPGKVPHQGCGFSLDLPSEFFLSLLTFGITLSNPLLQIRRHCEALNDAEQLLFNFN